MFPNQNNHRLANPKYARANTWIEQDDPAAHLRFDGRWREFNSLVPDAEELSTMTDHDVCDRFGWDADTFKTLVDNALTNWRNSPSRSLVNVIANMNGTTEAKGAEVFSSDLSQGRAVLMALETGLADPADRRFVRGADGKAVMIAGNGALLTLTGKSLDRFGAACRMLRIWELRNRARVQTGAIKLPKRLFRGIRAGDIDYDREAIPKTDNHRLRQLLIFKDKLDTASSEPIASWSESPILSFTSSRKIAETFTKHEGLILEVDPREVDIVSCWSTDEALDGKDHILNRHEREFIVRVSPEYKATKDQVHNLDRNYFVQTHDPVGIPMVDHHTVADYMLEGRRVRAMFVYNNNGIGGSVKYRVGSEWDVLGRNTWKRQIGFDPVPDQTRRAENLTYYNVCKWSGRREDIPKLDPNSFREHTSAPRP